METRRAEGSEGYKEKDNEKLAKEVRHLIYKASQEENINKKADLLNEANIISLELIRYLAGIYTSRNNFQVYVFQIPVEEITNVDTDLKDFLFNESSVSKELQKLKVHDIGIVLKEMEENDFYSTESEIEDIPENENIVATIFIDDSEIPYIEGSELSKENSGPRRFKTPLGESGGLSMPKEFYSFLQRMGITVNVATKLYHIHKYPILPTTFKKRFGSWDLILEEKEKL